MPPLNTGSNVGASKETGEPNHGDNAGGRSVWWKFTPQSSGLAVIDTFGSSFDTTLGVYSGNAVTSLSPLASNDDAYILMLDTHQYVCGGVTT